MSLFTDRIFVSSTWLDLTPERERVEEVLHRLQETKFNGMEYFGSDPQTTRDRSLAEVDRSQAYIGIFAGRYGSGITEDEYRQAIKRKLPCYVYLKNEATIGPEGRDVEPEKLEQLKLLKEELIRRHTVTVFNNPDDLAAKVSTDIHRWLFKRYLTRLLVAAAVVTLLIGAGVYYVFKPPPPDYIIKNATDVVDLTGWKAPSPTEADSPVRRVFTFEITRTGSQNKEYRDFIATRGLKLDCDAPTDLDGTCNEVAPTRVRSRHQRDLSVPPTKISGTGTTTLKYTVTYWNGTVCPQIDNSFQKLLPYPTELYRMILKFPTDRPPWTRIVIKKQEPNKAEETLVEMSNVSNSSSYEYVFRTLPARTLLTMTFDWPPLLEQRSSTNCANLATPSQ